LDRLPVGEVVELSMVGFCWPVSEDCSVDCLSVDDCRSTRLRLRVSVGEELVSDLALEWREGGGM